MLGFLGSIAFFSTQGNSDTNLAYIILSSLGLASIIFYYRSQTSKLVLNQTELKIFSDMTNYTVQLKNLRLEQTRLLNLRLEPELQAAFRTWGTGLPKYATGYFTLVKQQQAYIFVSDDTQVVHVPAIKGEDLLLSLENPQAFIAALKEANANT